jgi:riboflavin-specific deaminase-like protein
MTSMPPLERTGIQRKTQSDLADLMPTGPLSAHLRTAASFEPILGADRARPFVVAQLGQSLDGRIATTTGQSQYINGSSALDHLHALRAHVDAVVVGIGTVLADDPRLTVRRVPGRNPARVIVDPNGRLPEAARCLQGHEQPNFVIRSRPGATPPGVDPLIVTSNDEGRIEPAAIVAALFARGMRRILIEGGADTVSRFIDAGCIDRLHVMVAPMIIGSGKPCLDLAPIRALEKALRPPADVYVLDDGNVLFDCDLSAGRGTKGEA